MYELEPLNPAVAAQVDALTPWAFVDYEAALAFVLTHPRVPEVFNARLSRFARMRKFGLGRGSILYTPHPSRPMLWIDSVSFLHAVPD